MSYYILPKNNNNLIVNPQSNIDDCKLYSSYSLYNFYNVIQKQITDIFSNDSDLSINYEELIKIVNPYEYVFFKVPGSKFSVSKLKPKSSEFYDLLEIIMTLNIFEPYNDKSIKSLHISSNSKDLTDCIEMLRENYVNDIMYNFNTISNIQMSEISDIKFDFMFFNDYYHNTQSYIIRLIEFIMSILRYQCIGGTSIIKIDHIFHKPIIDLLYLMTSLFEKVYIIKPNTSNVTTFEKYIVAKNFNLCNQTKTEIYKSNYNKLNHFIKNIDNKNIVSIIDMETPSYFINKIDDINVILGQQQLESLNQIINILKNKNKEERIENIKKSSIQKAVSWCEKFNIPCNKFSEKTNIFLPIIKEFMDKEDVQMSDANIVITLENSIIKDEDVEIDVEDI